MSAAAGIDWPKPCHVTAAIQTIATANFRILIALLPAKTRRRLEIGAKIADNQSRIS
jgi:hypothetical protein